MKTLFAFLLALFISPILFGQVDDRGAEYREFWDKTEMEYKNPQKSPLSKAEIAKFNGIPRYDYNPKYRVKATWVPTPYEKPFKIEETGPRKSSYQKVAEVHFKIGDDSLKLAAYQNLTLMRNPEFKDYIFMPFTDMTNGFDTYGGGRYLDFDKPSGDSVIIDFNIAYNPYCAYNDKFSCPIPPRENHLDVKIPAGAKFD